MKTFQRIFSYNSGCKRKLWAIFLPQVHLWKKANIGKPALFVNINISFKLEESGFLETLNTCRREWKLLSLYMFHRIIFVLLIVSSLSCDFNRCAICFYSFMNIACMTTLNAAHIKRFWRLHIVIKRIKPINTKINIINSLLCSSVTLLMFIQEDEISCCKFLALVKTQDQLVV